MNLYIYIYKGDIYSTSNSWNKIEDSKKDVIMQGDQEQRQAAW